MTNVRSYSFLLLLAASLLFGRARARAEDVAALASDETDLRAASPDPPRSLEARLDDIEREYAGLQLDDARAHIDAVLADLAASPAAHPSSTRVRAHVLAAAVARARGELEACDVSLDAALALDPVLRLDPALHPPPLLEALERRRALRPPETTVVSSVPAGEPEAFPRRPEASDGTDPWPFLGVGAGVAVLVGGAIVLAVVFGAPPASFDLRGTILP